MTAFRHNKKNKHCRQQHCQNILKNQFSLSKFFLSFFENYADYKTKKTQSVETVKWQNVNKNIDTKTKTMCAKLF